MKPGSNIEFTDLSSGNVTGWQWDFGDADISEEQNPKHSYSREDVYTVSLSVFNDEGKVNTLTRSAYIEITNEIEPTPTEIATPDSTPIPTPNQSSVSSLKVNPESAGKSLGSQQATVTALDKDGNPISGITINSIANGQRASVSPSSAVTRSDGTAGFKFRFGFLTNNGEIIFSANDIEVSVIQN